MERYHSILYFDTIAKAQKSYARCMEPLCREFGLTRCELDILLFLFNNPEFRRAADIVEHRGIAKSHVSLGVKSLEGRGLLRRGFPQEDRRTVQLILTEEGLSMAAKARDVQRDYFTRIYTGVTQEEFALWQAVTDKVCKNIDKLND